MKLTSLVPLFAFLVLTTTVRCQDEPSPDIEKEVEKEVGKELDNTVDTAVETVCQAFSPDDNDDGDNGDQGKPQPTKRGFFKKLWKGVKNAAVNWAVGKVVTSIAGGKRDVRPWNINGTFPWWKRPGVTPLWKRPKITSWWKQSEDLVKTLRELKDDGSQTDICEAETQKKVEKLKDAIAVLERVADLVQSNVIESGDFITQESIE